MKLTVKQIDYSKPKEKDYKLSDGGGLYQRISEKTVEETLPNFTKYIQEKLKS